MDITIKACDGKPFHGSDYYSLEKAVKQYEAELKLKKEKEEAERKAREEKQKKLEELRSTKLKEINEILNKAKIIVDEYEKETGNKLLYCYDDSNKKVVVQEVRNSIDFAWNNFYEDVFKAIKGTWALQ